MKTSQQWFDEYGESHQNHTNKTIHWICIPLIMFSLIGLLWSIPTPELFSQFVFPVNFGTLFLLLALLYYVLLSIPLALGMTVVAAAIIAGNQFLAQHISMPLWLVSLIIFAVAWVGQFIGHNIEGKKPSFFKDLQFLLIGPLWLMHFVFKKLGITF